MQDPCHIVIDITRVERRDRLESFTLLEDFIYPIAKNLHPDDPSHPLIFQHSTGIAAFQVTGRSAIAIQTYPEQAVIYIDIISDHQFDYLSIFEYAKSHFGSQYGYLQRVKRN